MTDSDLKDLWIFMLGAYGSKANSLGPVPSIAWKMALEGVSTADMRRGMRALMTDYTEWPPTAFQFRDLCSGAADIASLDDGQFVALAHELGVKTIGRTDRDGIVRDVQRAMRRDDDVPMVTN